MDVIMSNYKETFFIVPSYILDLPGLTLGFLRVYETIFQFWNKNLAFYMSNGELAKRSGIELRQVQYALDFFEKHRELTRVQKGSRRYLSRPERFIEIDCAENTQPCTPVHPPMHCSAPPPCTAVHPEYKEVEYKEDNNIKPLVDLPKKLQPVEYPETYYPNPSVDASHTTVDEIEALFALFYSVYPNKQKPREALKAFRKLKPTPEFVAMLIEDVKRRHTHNWLGRDRSKIPHPSTYLNSHEWEGEIFKSQTRLKAKTERLVDNLDWDLHKKGPIYG